MQRHYDYTHSLLKKQHAVLKKQQADLAKAISINIELTLEVYPYTTEYDEKNNTQYVGRYPEFDLPWDSPEWNQREEAQRQAAKELTNGIL